MEKDTREALEGSIQKWEKIVDGTGKDYGWENCPLCKLFLDREDPDREEACSGCPVSLKTGTDFCHDSPYIDWANATIDYPRSADTPERIKLAKKELKFLKSLRPKE